jgi:hypothetical protein
MDVQFGCARSDTQRTITRHCFRRQRKLMVEVARTSAVEAGLNDHVSWSDKQQMSAASLGFDRSSLLRVKI